MSYKAFVLLLVIVLVLGGGLGGAFAGGVALGKSQGDGAVPAANTIAAPTLTPSNQGLSGQPSQSDLAEIRQRIQSGEVTQEELSQLRQQFQGQAGGGPGGLGFGGAGGQGTLGRGGLVGTVESLDGNTLTVNTSQGPLQASLGEDTVIQMFAEGSLSDLKVGTRVTVTGQRGEDGSVQANSILLIPEGQEGVFGGGFAGGGRGGVRTQPIGP